MIHTEKYQSCMVLSGGGFRFAYYLGIHAALSQLGKAPDILLATCGGAIAAAIIQSLPDDTQRKQWLASEQMYKFFQHVTSSKNNSLVRTLLSITKRRLISGHGKRIPDLFNDYLFDINQPLPLPSASLQNQSIPVAIIAGRLLFNEADAGKPRENRKLFKQIIFCNERSSNLLGTTSSAISAMHEGKNSIAPELLISTDIPLADAVRASVSDMFYFRCHHYAGHDYIGGAIDLLPIEIANQLADKIITELKSPYDECIANPAVKAVFGIDGNIRLQQVKELGSDLKIDTSDMRVMLKSQQLKKHLNWRHNKIELLAPSTYPAYVAMIDAQWQYGYQRGIDALLSPGVPQ